MLTGTCHCGAVTIRLPRRPRTLTCCNCSICRRYGVLWTYCKAPEVEVVHEPGALDSYSWGDKALNFMRCATCGCITHWRRIVPRAVDYMGVNARNFEPAAIGAARVRLLDGADTWKYLT